MKSLNTILHPERYQGHQAKAPYFEGWYYKLISSDRQHRYAVIPGISLSSGADQPHSFVQVLDGISGETAYIRYPVGAFESAKGSFDVRIGGNRFSHTFLSLDLPDGSLSLKGHLDFQGITPWPVNLFSPGIMGWYAWIPKMECYHGVVSLDHEIRGSLARNGTELNFDQGRGYIEKDWGQAFPSAWVWMQSNHFDQPGTSLTASIAMIPWLGHAFRGMIIGLLHDGQLYRFATYTGAVTRELRIANETIEWVVQDRLYELSILARNGKPGDLRGPSRTDMGRRVPETLQAVAEVQLSLRRTKRVLYHGRGICGGLEIGGEIETLLSA